MTLKDNKSKKKTSFFYMTLKDNNTKKHLFLHDLKRQ